MTDDLKDLTPAELLMFAMQELGLERRELPNLLEVSQRTVARIFAGETALYPSHYQTLAARLYPVHRELAAEAAARIGKTLEQLGLVPKPPPPAPPPAPAPEPPPVRVPANVVPLVAQSLLYTAAESLEVPREALRIALLGVVNQAKDVGLSLDDLAAGLAAIPEASKPTGS